MKAWLRVCLIGCCMSPPCILAAETTSPPPDAETTATARRDADWRTLFNERNLDGWKTINYGGEGAATVANGTLELDFGAPMSGVTYTGNELPRGEYELSLQAKRIDGNDFFCGLTFPVGDQHVTLILGGWGGSLVGISCIDGEDASDNETQTTMPFERQRWYQVRVAVSSASIDAWVDDRQVVHQAREGHELSLRSEVQRSKPLGLSTYATRAAYRNIRWKPLQK